MAPGHTAHGQGDGEERLKERGAVSISQRLRSESPGDGGGASTTTSPSPSARPAAARTGSFTTGPIAAMDPPPCPTSRRGAPDVLVHRDHARSRGPRSAAGRRQLIAGQRDFGRLRLVGELARKLRRTTLPARGCSAPAERTYSPPTTTDSGSSDARGKTGSAAGPPATAYTGAWRRPALRPGGRGPAPRRLRQRRPPRRSGQRPAARAPGRRRGDRRQRPGSPARDRGNDLIESADGRTRPRPLRHRRHPCLPTDRPLTGCSGSSIAGTRSRGACASGPGRRPCWRRPGRLRGPGASGGRGHRRELWGDRARDHGSPSGSLTSVRDPSRARPGTSGANSSTLRS